MPNPTEDIADLQTAVLQLALKAAPGSSIRRDLSGAASMYPDYDRVKDDLGFDPRGGLSRDEVADLLRQVNAAREQGNDPLRTLRMLRNALEKALDHFDRDPQ